ncbi:MAG: hypothetical protein GYA17_08530 [Chloroflexi bacterium]|jgi:sec-independent protein translocase protein TatB|nr:hypothetical protein [Anaerolineaceae bacterium]NMB88395.1 hypothetical protein [Chloroflexota bacterium]
MNILNVGPLELLFILIIAIVVLGPEDAIKTTRKAATWIRKAVQSPAWKSFMNYSNEIRQLPTQIVRDAGLEDLQRELQQPTRVYHPSVHTNGTKPAGQEMPENKILPENGQKGAQIQDQPEQEDKPQD